MTNKKIKTKAKRLKKQLRLLAEEIHEFASDIENFCDTEKANSNHPALHFSEQLFSLQSGIRESLEELDNISI